MVIQCMKKFSLLDYPGKAACTLYTAGCNFRCPFCHNASLVVDTYKNKEIPEEDFFSYLNKGCTYMSIKIKYATFWQYVFIIKNAYK